MAKLHTSGLINTTKKILLSGATGLIGSRLRNTFLNHKHVVHTIGRNSGDNYYFDFAMQNQQLPRINEEYDLFVHCAWYTTHPHFWHSEINWLFYNNSVRLLDVLLPKIGKNITLGTCAEYDEYNSATLDNFRLGASKLSLRRTVFSMFSNENILWLPIYFAYGEGEPQSKLLSQIKSQRLRKNDIKNLDSIRDFIHFDDIARMVTTLIDRNISGVHDIGTGMGIRIGDLFDSPNLLYRFVNLENSPSDVKIARDAAQFWENSDFSMFESRVRSYIGNSQSGSSN